MKTCHTRLALFAAALGLSALPACKPPSGARSQTSAPQAAAESTIEGHQDDWGPHAIVGWAWDSAHPEQRLRIEVRADGKLLATADADQFRDDIKAADKGDGKYGMVFPTPDSLKDGKPHSIQLSVAGGGMILGGSPKTLTFPPDAKNP